MDYHTRHMTEYGHGSNFHANESLAEKLQRKDRRRMLWVATFIFWTLLTVILVAMAIGSQRFEFDGNRLRIVSYERGHVTMRDRAGSYLYVTATTNRFNTIEALAVEYLGETFSHPIGTHSMTSPADNTRHAAEVLFIQQVSYAVQHGPIHLGVVILCSIAGFFLLLLSIASFLYPYEFVAFGQAFNWRMRGGEPTEFGIFGQQLSGVVGVIAIFIFAMLIVAGLR